MTQQMQASVESLNCHTCGAPNEVDGDRFCCSYCGTTNTVTATVRAFYGRVSSQYSGPLELVSVVTGLVHATERIRSYTANQISAVTGDLESLQKDLQSHQKEEQAIQEAVNRCANDRGYAIDDRTAGFKQLLPLLYLLIAAGVTIWLYHYRPMVLVGGGILFAIITVASAGQALLAPVLGIIAAIYAVVVAMVGLAKLAVAPMRIKTANRALNAAEQELADRKTQHRDHAAEINANAFETLKAHSQLIAEMKTFIQSRSSYNVKKDDIPIGIQMDEALASLNDLTFGNIIKTIQECVRIVDVFERRIESERETPS